MKVLMCCYSHDFSTSFIACTIGCGLYRFIINGDTAALLPPVLKVSCHTFLCSFCFVSIAAVQRVAISFALHHVCWTGGEHGMHGDIHLVMEALKLIATREENCLIFLFAVSCVRKAFHTWPYWSLVLSASCWSPLIDI